MAEARRIPEPGFAGDDGAGDPALRTALEAYAGEPGDPARNLGVLLALQTARLLVPVVPVLGVPVLGEVDAAGLTHDKVSDMATALLTGRDGRQALLAFTGLDTLAAWRDDARPVPVTAALAARSAIEEGASALVLDVAGPATYAVEGEVLDGLARGWFLARTENGPAWLRPADEGDAVE
jgi:hypothetical protein